VLGSKLFFETTTFKPNICGYPDVVVAAKQTNPAGVTAFFYYSVDQMGMCPSVNINLNKDRRTLR